MKAVTNNSKKLVIVSAIAIALVTWLCVSFWSDAFYQRKDAALLNESNIVEDTLFSLSKAITDERAEFYSSFAIPDVSSDQLVQFRSFISATDNQFKALINKIDKLKKESYKISNYRYNVESIQKKIVKFENNHTRINVYRKYILAQAALPLQERDLSMHKYMFDFYGAYIRSANDLRVGTSYLHRKNDKNIIFSEEIKNSTWSLREASSQVFFISTRMSNKHWPKSWRLAKTAALIAI